MSCDGVCQRIPSAAFAVSPPGIEVEQPAGTVIAAGGTKSFGLAAVGHPVSVVFTIKNTGGAKPHRADDHQGRRRRERLYRDGQSDRTGAPGRQHDFHHSIRPTSDLTATKQAIIHIANNVPGRNPYDINLTGQSLSFTTDTDGDG